MVDSQSLMSIDPDDAIFMTARYGSYDSNKDYASLGDELPPGKIE